MKNLYFFCFIFLAVVCSPERSSAQPAWRPASSAPSFNRIDDISFTNDSTAYLGQDGLIYRSTDGGDNWRKIGVLPNDAYVRSIEFISDSVGFIGTIFDKIGGVGLYKTVDGGVNWSRINNMVEGGMYGICGLDHKGETIIGVGIYSEPGRFYISRDGGKTWKSRRINEAAALVDCLMLDENTFLISGNSASGRRGQILRSTDGGESWKEVAVSGTTMNYCWKLSMRENGFGIGSIEDSRTSFITYDYGESWEEIVVNAVTSEKLKFGGAYFLNDDLGWLGIQWGGGIWETKNGGQSWHPIDAGQAVNKIRGLANGKAIATGKSVYIYDDLSSSTEIPKPRPERHSLKVSPNPVQSRLNVDLDLIAATAVRLDIVDLQGRIVSTLKRESMTAGLHHLGFDVSGLSEGSYFVWLRTNEVHAVEKLTVIR